MKKYISILAFAAVSFLLLNSYSNGAPNKASGSPGDNNQNCTQSGCHVGTAQQVANMISTDIPSTGWEAGKTYNVTFSISETSISKFGFEVTAEDAQNKKVGTFTATANTKLVSTSDAITHVSGSTSGTGMKAWTFPWTAPVKGTGTITFYGAGNASDGRGTRTNDLIKLSSHSVVEKDLTSNIASNSNNVKVNVYPNPAINMLNVSGAIDGSFKIYNLGGLTLLQGNLKKGDNTIDVSSLETGTYFLYSENSFLVQKFMKY